MHFIHPTHFLFSHKSLRKVSKAQKATRQVRDQSAQVHLRNASLSLSLFLSLFLVMDKVDGAWWMVT